MKKILKFCMLVTVLIAGMMAYNASATRHQGLKTIVTRLDPEANSRQIETGRQNVRTGTHGGIVDMTQSFEASFHRGRQVVQRKTAERRSLAEEAGVTLCGNVIYARSWDESGDYSEGVYSFPAQKNTMLTPVYIAENIYANGGGVFDGDRFKFINYITYSDGSLYQATYYEYDIRTWSQIKSQQLEPSQYGVIANIISCDPVSDRYYGIFPSENSKGTDFGYVDYSTMTKTIIAPTDNKYIAMAINSSGEVYAVCQYGDLYKIDKNTGVSEYIGETGVYPAAYLQSMAFDQETGRLYWASQLANGKAWLVEIDTEYGEMTKISDFADDEEIVCLYVSRKIAEDGAPDKVTALSVKTDKASPEVSIEFTMPLKTYGGSDLSGTLKYDITANAEPFAAGEAKPGEKVSIKKTSPEGEVKFSVTATNDAGKGIADSYKTWIGYDVPKPVTGLTFSIDEKTNMAKLSWNASSEGVHGGYIEKITYEVTRYPGAQVVATGIEDTEWQESRPSGNIQEYSYEIVALNGDKKSSPVRSNSIITGDSYGVPYFCGFDSEASFNEFTILDINKDGRTWAFNPAYNAISYTYSSANAADDWAITPEIKFQTISLYNVSLKARSVNSSYPEKVSVWVGKGVDPAQYECVIPLAVLEGSDWHSLSGDFMLPADGNYRIGIKAESDAYMMQLQVDDISIVENGRIDAPDGVSDIKITPALRGELKATLAFMAPSKTIAGGTLESLERIEVYNGGRLVGELKPAPGQACTIDDNAPENGVNTYTIRAYNDKGAGKAVTGKTYVGVDIPAVATDVHVVDNDDHTTISWKAPGETGENGGYVDTSDLTYALYVVTGEGFVRFVKDNITGNTYDDYSQAFSGDQDMISYCVVACNKGGESARAYSNDVVIIGESYAIPFVESFARGEFRYPLWWGTRRGNTGFGKDVGSEDRDGGSVSWSPDEIGDECWLSSGKISLQNVARPVLSFSYKASSGADMSLEVEAAKNGKEVVSLKKFELKDSELGWHRNSIDLSGLKNERFIVLKFHGITNCADKRLSIDRIMINDMSTVNFAVELESKGSAVCGENTIYRVKVINLGDKPSADYKVALYADNKKVAEADGVEVGSMDQKWIEMSFRAPLAGSAMDIYAEVMATGDAKEEDNRSQSIKTQLLATDVPAVEVLEGHKTNEGLELQWTVPATVVSPTTEGFENYDAWSTDRFGRWTTANGNNGQTYAMNGIYFPLGGHVYAYTLFNPYDLGLDVEYVPQLAPKSGFQFAGAMSEPEFDDSDKWLISPRLSGTAQTISFYATGLASFYIESFRVLYSTTGNKVDDFKNVVLTEYNLYPEWTKFTANIPEEAKYFAIHCNSNYGFGFFVDDVTFIPGYELTGYNIYRNGELLQNVKAGQNTYVDKQNTEGKYTVTACYKEGESAHSETFDASLDGVTSVTAQDAYCVNGCEGHIAFKSLNGQRVRISDTAGTLHFDGNLSGDCTRALPQGIYIVMVDSNAHKILVK